MKKKYLLTLLPLIGLASCGSQVVNNEFVPYMEYRNGVPTFVRDTSSHVTYLLMSPFGSLNISDAPTKGEVSELFYENTIIWEAAAGTALPSASQVATSVQGASFRGWAYYDPEQSTIFPTMYTTVPTVNGLPLKAIFDGTISSGGGSGGGGGGGGGEVTASFGLMFENGTSKVGVSKGKNMDGKDEYLCSSVSFNAGDKFQLYDFANSSGWIANVAFNQWSFGSQGDGANIATYLKVSGDYWEAVRSFTADVYCQFQFENDSIYFELK